MAQPIIGLTSGRHSSRDNVRIVGASEAYVQAVLQAGAIPLLIPLGLSTAAVDRLAAQVDGLLFTGGGDVEPARYQSRPHPLVDSVDSDRDEIEIRLLRQAVGRRLPFLGICRGLQVINVALGGSLYEDLLDQCPGALKHQNFDDHPRDYLAHPVQVTPESRLGRVLQQDSLAVNSLHHQGIRQLAPNLTATAWAPDGVIEAVEIAALPFGVAVQWHPEWLPGDAGMRRLFAAFVEQAQTQR